MNEKIESIAQVFDYAEYISKNQILVQVNPFLFYTKKLRPTTFYYETGFSYAKKKNI